MNAQREGLRLAGAGRCWFEGDAGEASQFPHHQKIPTPIKARRITPTIVRRAAQRIASLAIRKKIASRMAPAMMEMVVNVIRDVSRQL